MVMFSGDSILREQSKGTTDFAQIEWAFTGYCFGPLDGDRVEEAAREKVPLWEQQLQASKALCGIEDGESAEAAWRGAPAAKEVWTHTVHTEPLT
jgi:hypothetical protein